jgi:alpha-1,2-mannosyltransferase
LTSLKPGQSQDLQMILNWLTTWFWQASSPYRLPVGAVANYPPHFISFLSPLALLPFRSAVVVWSVLNVAMAPFAGFVAFRIFKPDARRKAALLPCAMFLSWAGLRVGLGNGQFTLLALTFGLLATLTADRRPLVSGVLLALALTKPHVGAAFLLWAVFTKRYKIVGASVAVAFAGLVIFCLRLGENLVAVIGDFFRVLNSQLAGKTFLAGIFELRPLVHVVIPYFTAAEAVHFTVILVLLCIIGVAALRMDSGAPNQRDTIVLQLFCLWDLIAVYHSPYDSVIMLPVVVGLYLAALGDPSTYSRGSILLWIVQLALVIEVPFLGWKLSEYGHPLSVGYLRAVLAHFDRMLLIVVCCYVLYLNRHHWASARP